jgi:subtilisin family serine protease
MVHRLERQGRIALRRLFLLFVLCALLGGSANAAQLLIVQDTLGQALLNVTCTLLGCNVIEGLGDPAGQVFLVGVPDGVNLPAFIQTLLSVIGIVDVEADNLVSVLQSSPATPASLYDDTPVSYYGTTVWQGYVTQPAVQIVGIANVQSTYGSSGTGIVAVIDTGVDPNQPVLQPVLVPGYDFTRNTPGGSEMADVPVSSSPGSSGASPSWVNGDSEADLSESTVSVVDNQQYAAFGHGTMVSGVIHLAAPTALIMPLKAFQATGYGYTSDIIRAIYWAVSHNARVINMSFSTSQSSLQLALALDYATTLGTICVASAGNDSSSTPVYPAAYSNVIGVASTSNSNTLSTFSNYGSWVWLAAPGEGIITTYPWATYAAAWGTSFSAPFVSGTASLLLQQNWSTSQPAAASDVGHAQPVSAPVGHGVLAIVQAIQAAISGQ